MKMVGPGFNPLRSSTPITMAVIESRNAEDQGWNPGTSQRRVVRRASLDNAFWMARAKLLGRLRESLGHAVQHPRGDVRTSPRQRAHQRTEDAAP